MSDIIKTPPRFFKKYELVLHLRLEDFVIHNWYIKKERIVELLDKIKLSNNICIVCNKPETEFEINYIKYIIDFLKIKMLIQ